MKLTGKNNSKALQEIHIFLAPLNPDETVLNKYYDLVNKWNKKNSGSKYQMKACHLALVFRRSDGTEQTVRVMQSARYIRCDDTNEVIEEGEKDCEYFENNGLDVIRLKIEATAYGIDGVPVSDEDAKKKGKYFECHIKVGRKERDDTAAITDEEIDELRRISREFSRKFQIPVPLSYNYNKNKFNTDGQGHQRFLNVRFRDMGLDSIKPKLDEIHQEINNNTSFRHIKDIFEYVWYDTNPGVDKGWIDFSDEELENINTLFSD